MRNQHHYTDYNHIRVYGTIMEWDKGFIKGQQHLAMMLNAPADTCEISTWDRGTDYCERVITRFYDLDKAIRQQFNGVVINGKG